LQTHLTHRHWNTRTSHTDTGTHAPHTPTLGHARRVIGITGGTGGARLVAVTALPVDLSFSLKHINTHICVTYVTVN
jgi:hypothetical protein